MKSESRSVMSDSLRPVGLHSPWNSLGQNTGVGSLSFLQGIFPTQVSNLLFRYWQVDSLPLSHQGKVKVKVTQSCPNLFNPMDCIVHGVTKSRMRLSDFYFSYTCISGYDSSSTNSWEIFPDRFRYLELQRI